MIESTLPQPPGLCAVGSHRPIDVDATLARSTTGSADVICIARVSGAKERIMAKFIKGLASRKPPEPSSDHSDIDAWIERQMPHLQPLVNWLDESIRDAIPRLQFAVKWKRPYYGLSELGWIIELAAYDVSVNVVFLGGADFETPPPLGTTDRTRYIKLTSIAEASESALNRFLGQAGRTPGWMWPTS